MNSDPGDADVGRSLTAGLETDLAAQTGGFDPLLEGELVDSMTREPVA